MADDKKILITGTTGLLGNHFLNQNKLDCEIYAIVRTLPKSQVDHIKYIVTDLTDPDMINMLPDKIDIIIHLAQSDRFRDFPDEALDVFRVNIASTAKLIDFAYRVGAKKFIYASSGGVYGTGNDAFHENSPIIPPGKLGYYLGSKFCSETLASSYSSVMQIIILRFFFMYGRGQKKSMLIPRLVENIKNNIPINLQGNNGIRINPIHVNDAVRVLAASIDINSSNVFNIGGAEILSLRDIADIIGNKLNINPIFDIQESVPNDLIGNISSMNERLVPPIIDFEEGIKSLLTT